MARRLSLAWLPLALVALIVGHWASLRAPRPRAGSDRTTAGQEEAKPSPAEEKPESGGPSASAGPPPVPAPDGVTTPGAMAAWETAGSSTREPREMSVGTGTTDGSAVPSTSTAGALSGGAGTTRPYGTEDESDETDPGWDEGTGAWPKDSETSGRGSPYGSTTSGTGSEYGRDTTTGYGTDTTTRYGTDTTTRYGTDTTTDYGTDTTSRYGTDTTTARVPREAAYSFHLFDAFEGKAHQWAVESAADHAELKLTSAQDRFSEGEQSLQATFKAFGKGNFELRREVSLDLTNATTLRVDVYNEAGPLDLVLGCRAGYDTTLFTTPPKPIQTGWNRDVSFSLAELSANEGGGFGTSWHWSRDQVSRVSLIFRERDQEEGTVHIDNIRFDRPTTELGHKTKPSLKKIIASGKAVERFEPLELAVEFEADYQDFFDRTEIDVLASFLSPSGKRLEVHGFVHDTDAETAKAVWKVRFTPNEVGVWRYDVTVRSAGGDTPSGTYSFTCHRKADRRGFIRRSGL